MRTTVDLDEALLERAKRAAAGESRTLGAVLNDALRAYLTGRKAVAREEPFELIVCGQPGGRFPSAQEIERILDDEDVASLAMPGRAGRAAP